jgi:uncharacterized protein (TIGR03437 family)
MTTTKKIVWMSVGTWVAIVPALLLAYSSGPDVRYTGAPGDNPQGCAARGCHTSSASGGPVNPAGGSVVATFSGGTTYTPGQTQTVTVTISDPQNKSYGFQMSARLGTTTSDLSTKQGGTFVLGPGTQVLCDNNSIRKTTCPANAPVEFIEHTSPSTKAFTFQWTAPAAGSGPVTFYVAGNAVNGNGREDGGDHVYLANITLTEAAGSTCTALKPAITAVVEASQFGQSKSFSAGAWLEIYGTNLTTANGDWSKGFTGNSAPTKVNDVLVSINQKPAVISFVSSGQVNVQAPADTSTGPVNVTVTNCNSTSDAFPVTKGDVVPGVYSTVINGKNYLGAFVPGTATFTGIPSAPAKPGDVITAFGIGFGDTTPAVTTGTITQGLSQFPKGAFTVLFGTAPDPSPLYAGLGPNFVGLYQFNLTVPKLADGDYQMVFQIGSVKVPQTLLFSVKN